MADNLENIKQKVAAILKKISGLKLADKELLSQEYLDAGLINSLQVVEMIVALEDAFKIKFLPEDLQSFKFRTGAGLAGLIKEITARGN